MNITGTMMNYYYHCERHLWFFAHNINMEQNSDTVAMGKFISESSYTRTEHELDFKWKNLAIRVDFYDKVKKTLHEVKKSDKLSEIHVKQLQFYMYVFKKMGIQVFSGELNYPLLRKKVPVELSEKDCEEIEKSINSITEILKQEQPPPFSKKKYCVTCSYFELCFIE